LISCSPLPSFWDPSVIARELTIDEIGEMVRDYEYSCGIIAQSGIDAIEIHAHQGYLLDQFTTAIWNRRTDKYGGDLEGRLRFPLEIVAAARRAVGPDFPIIYRYGLTHYFEGGRTVEEGQEIARRLEAAGVDALDIDCGAYETNNRAQPPTTQPLGCMVELAELAKQVVKIPVVTVGKLGFPDLAERVLQEDKADFVSLGRPLLADPDWPNKVKEGRPEDIIPCIGCHEGCLRRALSGKHISCAVNPACGCERDYTITPVEKKKRVLVIGGGPGGMEAARVATLRGHEVTLWEKGYSLGGNLVPAAIPDFKMEYKLFLDYLITQIKKLGIKTRFNLEATPELVEKFNADVVFIATGATPIIPDYPGMKEAIAKGKVVTAVDALLGEKEIGKRVVIIGGGLVGCETGLWLAQQGKSVTVIARHEAMREMWWVNAKDVREKLDEAKAKLLTFTNVIEITDDGVVIADDKGKQSTLKADSILLAVRMEPDRALWEALRDRLPEAYAIGDCVESRMVLDAMWEGYRTARLI
jgi:2-enoate reductase